MKTKDLLIKELLQLNIFEANIYFYKYIDLIINNQTTNKIKYETEKHHIIPRSYFISRKLKILNENNLVNLKYSDHILAHYYLCLCLISEKDKNYNLRAFMLMTKEIKNKVLDLNFLDNLAEYDRIRKEYKIYNAKNLSILQKGKHHVSEAGKKSISEKNSVRYSNTVWIHKYLEDGSIYNIRVKIDKLNDYLDKGYIRGRNDKKCYENISNALKGKPNGMLGKKQSDYQKEQVSKKLKGVAKSDEAKKNMSLKKKNKYLVSNKITKHSLFIDKEDLEKYLNLGYVRGRIFKSR